MTKQNGTIITIVVAIITFLCCTGPLCSAGAMIFADLGTWNSEFGSYSDTGTIPQSYGVAPCCLSILVLVAPLLCWLFLVRGKENAVTEEYIEGSFEDDIGV